MTDSTLPNRQQPLTARPVTAPATDPSVIYERIGGAAAFQQLVAEFYKGVANDPPLREMYPEEDLAPAEDRLRMFLEQYFGGPKTYHEQRGHPRLRMRHMPFVVTPTQRDRWLVHMRAALDSLQLEQQDDEMMWNYFEYAANFMMNAPDSDDTTAS